jgi:hypothetical protein
VTWNFGDGSSETVAKPQFGAPKVQHTYATAGTKTVTETITTDNLAEPTVKAEAHVVVQSETQAEKEKAEREKAEKEAKEKAEREAKERAEREAKEKAEREAKEKAEREAEEKAEKGPAPTITKLSAKKGPAAGGTAVTITGTSFLAVRAVKFGTVNAASFEVQSTTSITAVSPPGTTGTVEIHVTTPSGVSGITAKDHFAYEAPTVTSVSTRTGPKAGNTPVTVTGSGFAVGSGSTSFTFGKGIATAVNCASTTECTLLSPAAAKAETVDVRAKTGGKTSKKNPPVDQYTYD